MKKLFFTLSLLCKVRLYRLNNFSRNIYAGSLFNTFQSRHDIDFAKIRFFSAKKQINSQKIQSGLLVNICGYGTDAGSDRVRLYRSAQSYICTEIPLGYALQTGNGFSADAVKAQISAVAF